MKRTIMIAGALLIAAVCLYANGGGEEVAMVETGVDGNFNATGFPIVKDKVTLHVITKQLPNMTDMKDNAFLAWYEEKTNVHIDVETVAKEGAKEKRNLILASGAYPGIFLNMDIKPDIEMQYAPQGVFHPLNGLIQDYGVNLKQIFEEKPYIRKLITNPDGNIYALPGVSESTNNALKYRCHINMVWLDEVGMDIPTTTDELYDVLKAFKSRDPNGNGLDDEIPLAGAKTTGRESLPQVWLMAPFILNDPKDHMVVENGKVRLAAVQPEYREGLRWIHKLHEEGLFDGESFTRDSDQLEQLASKDGEEVLGCAVCKSYYMIMDRASERAKHWVFVPPLVGPNGDQHVWYDTSSLMRGKFAVTDRCDHPEAALRWADWMYSEEGTTRAFYGFEEGVNWYRPPAGTPSKGGEGDAKYARPAGWTVPELDSDLLGNNGLFYLTEAYVGSWEADPNDMVRLRLNAVYKAYEPAAKKDSQSILPDMYLTVEESNEIGLLQTPINAYIDQSFARFVIGDLDIEEDWHDYVKSLEKMNIGRLLEIYQKNVDIFNRG